MFPISNFSRILYRYSKIPTSEQDTAIVGEFQKIFPPDCNLSKRSQTLFKKECKDARFSTTESFERWFARILVYEIQLLLQQNSNHLQYLKQICDPKYGCRCCESWNEGIYHSAEKEAVSMISALVEAPSEFSDIFRKYGRKAMKNAWRRHFAHFEMLKQSKKRIEKALKEPEKSVPEEEFRNLPFVNYFDYDGEAPIYD
jgi:hypothetical protein